jgi:hypothetical protein
MHSRLALLWILRKALDGVLERHLTVGPLSHSSKPESLKEGREGREGVK